jgi:hypothetical protein
VIEEERIREVFQTSQVSSKYSDQNGGRKVHIFVKKCVIILWTETGQKTSR